LKIEQGCILSNAYDSPHNNPVEPGIVEKPEDYKKVIKSMK
jgi:hypothetical protein